MRRSREQGNVQRKPDDDWSVIFFLLFTHFHLTPPALIVVSMLTTIGYGGAARVVARAAALGAR
jgi:hypothetical protein